MTEAVNHPAHYGGADNPYKAIKVIEAWGLGFCLGNATKYIKRAGKKDDKAITDLKKARWYIDREIASLERMRGVCPQCHLAPLDAGTVVCPCPWRSRQGGLLVKDTNTRQIELV